MSLLDPTNTLSYHASRGLCLHRDMSSVPCSNVVKMIVSKLAKPGLAQPETSALSFYSTNHGKAILGQTYHPLEPLPLSDVQFLETYHRVANREAIRAFYYLLLICVRESRHVLMPYDVRKEVGEKFGQHCAYFNAKIDNVGSHQAYQYFLNHPPEASIGDFCKSLQYIFYHGHFNNGFGGNAWGAVADCLVSFVTGEFSAEIMVDTVWTLSHNNGPIFNKGMLYSEYSPTLIRILDVQRSGQIAEACLSDDEIKPFVSDRLVEEIEKFKSRHPGHFGEYVDWYAVEARGAVLLYPEEKAVQAQVHGLTDKQAALISEAQKKKLADAIAKVEVAKNFHKHNFEYWPGKTVPILAQPKARAA